MKKIIILLLLLPVGVFCQNPPALIPYLTADGVYGYTNSQKKLVIKPRFENARPFTNGLAWVKENKKWGLINAAGDWVYPPANEDAKPDPFSGPLTTVIINKQYGMINRQGKLLVPAVYFTFYGSLQDGLYLGYKSGGWDLINSAGKITGTINKDLTGVFGNGLAPFKEKGKVGYLDKTGKVIIPPQFDFGRSFSEGLAAVRMGEKWGYINKTGKIIIPVEYDWAESFEKGISTVKKGDKYAIINSTGKLVTGFAYDVVYSFYNGIAVAGDGEKYGLINTSGKWVLSPAFPDMGSLLTEGLVAAANSEELYGYINLKGEWVISPAYQYAAPFSNGLAEVKIELPYGNKVAYVFIDKKGTKYWDHE